MAAAFAAASLTFQREVNLGDGNIVDFMVGASVGIVMFERFLPVAIVAQA